jgi:hypothetical protein
LEEQAAVCLQNQAKTQAEFACTEVLIDYAPM